VLKKTIEVWGGTAGRDFTTFLFQEIAPLMIKEPFKPEFDLSDGGFNSVRIFSHYFNAHL
jgi:hypothetical protein